MNTIYIFCCIAITMIFSNVSVLGDDWKAIVCAGGLSPSDSVYSIDVNTNTPGPFVVTGPDPQFVAITPDASTAYVSNQNDGTNNGSVAVVDLTVSPMVVKATIPLGLLPEGLALSPDGTKAYICNLFDGTVSVIDIASNAIIDTISAGSHPTGIALSPDGTKGYVTNNDTASVTVIDLATSGIITQIPLDLNSFPLGIAITPDGTKAYIAYQNIPFVGFVDLVTYTHVSSIAVGGNSLTLAIDHEGTKVCVGIRSINEANIIDIATNTVTVVPLPPSAVADGVGITPDGATAYISDLSSHFVYAIDLQSLNVTTVTIPSSVGNFGLAITPDQAPTARFTMAVSGTTVTFDASSSSSPTGSIATYAWDFGDGQTLTTSAPVVTHTYSTLSESLSVTLVVTNTAGTSLSQTFTGQTVSNNGGPSAKSVQTLTAPIRPKKFKGKLFFRRHAKKLRACTKWKKSSSSDVVKYQIYAFHHRIATISATHARKHKIHLHPHGFDDKKISKKYSHYLHKKYRIRAVNSFGIKSTFTPLHIVSRKVKWHE